MDTLKEKIIRAAFTLTFGFVVSVILNSALILKAPAIFKSLSSDLKSPVAQAKGYEVFGFAPYWTINKLDNVNYSVLTTLAYFGVPIGPDGEMDTSDVGYTTLNSDTASKVFNKAQNYGTRVVLTITQMDRGNIEALLDDPDAQQKSIDETIALVKQKNLDGVNIDYEYIGVPGDGYREKFNRYVSDFALSLHDKVKGSQLTVSVIAASMKTPHLYDIASISKSSDAIFMMAYDFATSSSDTAMPTSPLYGHKEGKYWYDVSTAVNDFLTVMPADKLILGLPWYGYNYPVTSPGTNVSRYQGYSYYYWWRGRRYIGYYAPSASAQTYAVASSNANEASGWDDYGKVGWKAYRADGIWRMIFLEDAKSLKIKYDFAKDKNLAGVGVWALGFDSGTNEMWNLLASEFAGNIAMGPSGNQ